MENKKIAIGIFLATATVIGIVIYNKTNKKTPDNSKNDSVMNALHDIQHPKVDASGKMTQQQANEIADKINKALDREASERLAPNTPLESEALIRKLMFNNYEYIREQNKKTGNMEGRAHQIPLSLQAV